MSGDATLPLQAAIATAVKADAALGALGIDQCYDWIPDRTTDAAGPVMAFGPMFAAIDDTHGILGQDTIVQIDVWSRARGRVVVHQVLAALDTLLHRSGLSVSGHQMVVGLRVLQRVEKDPDGVTIHGLAQYRFTTHE